MASFYRLSTDHGTWLAVDLATRWMLHAAPEDLTEAQVPLVLVRPSPASSLAFLAALDGDVEAVYPPLGHLRAMLAVHLKADPPSGRVLPINLQAREPIAFSLALNEFRHGGVTEGEAGEPGFVTLHAVDPDAVPEALQRRAEALERILAAPKLLDGLVGCLDGESPAACRDALRAMTFVIPPETFRDLAERLLWDVALRVRLQRAFPGDVWAERGLGQLAEHLDAASEREQRPGGIAAPVTLEQDHLASDGLYGRPVSFTHAANLFARSRVRPVRGTCVVTSARNEGANLVEWIAYHRCIGVDAIHIYSNDNEDGSDRILAALARAGVITYFESHVGRVAPQAKAFGHALGLDPRVLDYEWAAIIDLDEFLVTDPDMFRNWNEFTAWHAARDVDAVALNWVMMGSDDDPARRKIPVTRRFRRQLGGANNHIKTMFRPGKFIHSGPHFPHSYRGAPFTFVDAAGRPHVYDRDTDWVDAPALSLHPAMSHASVFHYFFKSAEDYLSKFARNRGDVVINKTLSLDTLDRHFLRSYVGQARSADTSQTDWAVRCAPNLEEEIEFLLALPDVAQAQLASDALAQERLAKLRQIAVTTSPLRSIVPEGPEFLDILAGR
jgi:hypothetical protein